MLLWGNLTRLKRYNGTTFRQYLGAKYLKILLEDAGGGHRRRGR